jgi:hypothetical protein
MSALSMNMLFSQKKELLDYTQLSSYDFDTLSSKLLNKEYLKSVDDFLHSVVRKFTPTNLMTGNRLRKFLSAYTMIFHKEVVLSDDNFSNHLFELAKKMVFNFDDLFTNNFSIKSFTKFLNSFTEYCTFFERWRQRDSLIQIRPMIKTYVEINLLLEHSNNLTEERRNEYINMKKILRKKTKNIAGQEGLHSLENGQVTYFKDEKIFTDVERTVRRAFWDVFEENFNAQKYEHIKILLDDVKQFIFDLVPRRTDLHREINENVDSELIYNMIVNNAITQEQILGVMMFIIKYIEMLQEPSQDEDTRLFKQNLLDKCNSGVELPKLLRFFFSTTLMKLERIKKVTDAFRKELSKQ